MPNSESPPDMTPPRSTWFLERLLTGPHRKHHPSASQLIGLLGLLVYTLLIAAVAAIAFGNAAAMESNILKGAVILMATGCVYVVLLMTTQWFASCQLPLCVRFGLVFATIFCCVQILAMDIGEPITGAQVLMISAVCWGGFVQQHRGWRALHWQETLRTKKKLSIGEMLDVTATIALILAMLQTEAIPPQALLCFIPGAIFMMALGMHVWGRLTALCTNRTLAENGFVAWVVGHILWAVLGVLLFNQDLGIWVFVLLPVIFALIQVLTAVPLWWLSICGWHFDRRPHRVRPAPEYSVFLDSTQDTDETAMH